MCIVSEEGIFIYINKMIASASLVICLETLNIQKILFLTYQQSSKIVKNNRF